MENKIFLEKCRSKESTNTSGGLSVRLKGNRKLLPLNDVSEVISLMEQYDEERAACNKIRLTCQVNTVCSNVLFNSISEIVKYEGSDHVTFLNYGSGGTDDVDEAFKNGQVIYKPDKMSFWSGGTMNYQSQDERLVTAGPSTELRDIDRKQLFNNRILTGTDGHPTNAIRDTQLSKKDKTDDKEHFVYHCGLDFFNNHLVRSKTFKCICKMSDYYDVEPENWGNETYCAFNTIADVMRESNGDKVIEKIYLPDNSGLPEGTKLTALHTYLYDDILTFKDATSERLIEKYNGWFGFSNTSKIKTYENFSVGTELNVERPIMYMNGGDFVDMYPGRDLYSFVPKYNKYRNRMEQNWLYCLTYPSSSTTDGFDDIIEQYNNSLKAVYFDETRRADSGAMQLVIYSKAKHGLASGDRVNIYKTYYVEVEEEKKETTTEGEQEEEPKKKFKRTTELVIANAEVNEIVDEFIFTTFTQGVQISNKWAIITEDEFNSESGFTITEGEESMTYRVDRTHKYILDKNDERFYIINEKYVNLDPNAQNISYKKVVSDIECDYYVRIFSRLPNFKFASGDTTNEYNIYRKEKDAEDKEKENMLEIYQKPEYAFESHVSRLAFAQNIYADPIGQIVFTDDIDISNIHDNLGRPLSEIYLTIVKNNRGYKEWYGYDGVPVDINSEKVEFSHCFGVITCGFEMSYESSFDPSSNNIRKINPLDGINWGYPISDINPNRSETTRSYEISFDEDINYYGDLCYFDSSNAIERVIQPMLHRFNTAQRECGGGSTTNKAEKADHFRKFAYDEITKDDYDYGDAFIVKPTIVDECNNRKEGYFYQPHHAIKIKSFGKLNTIMPDFLDINSIVAVGEDEKKNDIIRVTTRQYHFLTPGDKAVIYDKSTDRYYYLTAIPGAGDNSRVFNCAVTDEKGNPSKTIDGDNIGNYKLFKIDNFGVPSYANLLKDGTCRYIWRDIINNGSMDSEKSLEVYPFTNGAFYINKLVNLYVRRQDPYEEYGLYDSADIFGVEAPYEETNNFSSEDEIKC